MKSPVIDIDFETRSVCDLRKTGSHIYAHHPTTDILCMAYSMNGESPGLWIMGEPMPFDVMLAIDDGASVVAHNAAFELAVWNGVGVRKYGWPPLKVEQTFCTMTMCYALGLPGSLDNASRALGINHKKDTKGHRIMLQLCKPRKGPSEHCKECKGTGINARTWNVKRPKACPCVAWWEKDDPAKGNTLSGQQKYDWLYRYCIQDVIVEREILKRVLPLAKEERESWILDQQINQRGIHVDLESVQKAINLVEMEKKRLNLEVRDLTGSAVATCNAVAQMKAWIETKDIEVESLAKADILDLLERDDLPDEVRKILEIRQLGSKSSNAKLTKIVNQSADDARIRGQFQWHGAASTGRWAGRGVQLQNLPRPRLKQSEIEGIISILEKVG